MTSIMCTLSPGQVDAIGLVPDLCAAGMDSVRFNTAHFDSVDALDEAISRLKSLNPGLKVLIDTKGPELRTLPTADDKALTLRDGDLVEVKGGDIHSEKSRIYVNWGAFGDFIRPGDRILVDDGKIELTVVDGTLCRVVNGGDLGSRKGVSVVGRDLPLPAVSDRDRMFISYAARSPLIDMVAHSFVRSADDLLEVKRVMGISTTPIIAKIENQQGIDNLTEIIRIADGLLIARGDLSAEIGSEAVPSAQAMIASATKKASKPLFLATYILTSMIGGDTAPSESDCRGITTAIDQGVDVMLLTNETAQGVDPISIVKALRREIINNEDHDY